MLTGTQPSRLVDKAQPENPFAFALDGLKEEEQINERTRALLNALLQRSPHDRRSALEALNIQLEQSIA
jgi:hypothetical protein